MHAGAVIGGWAGWMVDCCWAGEGIGGESAVVGWMGRDLACFFCRKLDCLLGLLLWGGVAAIARGIKTICLL